jgi:ArsR family transcriptional regulator
MVVYNHFMSSLDAPILAPRQRQQAGCCEPRVEPDVSAPDALALAAFLKALADPTRLRIVDTLRKAAPEALCQCELTPLFEMSQQALAKHLGVLTRAGLIGSERRGVWTYYFIRPESLKGVKAWLA